MRHSLILPFVCLFWVLTTGVVEARTDSEEKCDNCEDAPVAASTFLGEIKKIQQETLEDILSSVDEIPEDKRSWKPTESSRSALDLCRDLAKYNYGLAGFLQRKRVGSPPAEDFSGALEQVKSAFSEVAVGIDALPPSEQAEELHVDTSALQATMREFLMRHLVGNAQMVGELKALVDQVGATSP